jgi:hypothetical protein
MHDVAGRSVQVGDVVAATWNKYPDLRVGVITRFTPKKIAVGFKGQYADGSLYEELKFTSQICFISRKS